MRWKKGFKAIVKSVSKGYNRFEKGVEKTADGLIKGKAKPFKFKHDKQFVIDLRGGVKK